MIDILVYLQFLASGLAGLVITQPFLSVLFRYRANYAPRVPEVHVEGVSLGMTQENIGYFGMMKRVYRIEGWTGFYKGFMPALLSLLLSVAITSRFWFDTLLPSRITNIVGIGRIIPSVLVFLLVGIPYQIIISRSIVTPYRLPIFRMSISLRALLTLYERRRPLTLYLTPGLALTLLLLWVLPLGDTEVNLRLIHQHFILTGLQHFALSIIFATFSVPLQVIAAKLSVQRNLGPGGEEAGLLNSGEETGGVGLEEYSDVSVNRTRLERYTGLIDCVVKIVREEGWQTLFRCWWITILPHLLLQLFYRSFA